MRLAAALACTACVAACASPAPGQRTAAHASMCQATVTNNAAFDEAGSPMAATCELAKSLRPPAKNVSDALR